MSFADEEGQNNKVRNVAIGIVIVLLAGGGAWWWMNRDPPKPPTESTAAVPAGTPAPAADPPAIKHPLPPAPEAAPTAAAAPVSVDPDTELANTFGEVFGNKLSDWLIPDQLVRRLVATVDNLPRNARTEARRPLRPPSGPFVVTREVQDAVTGTERIALAPANFARYNLPVEVFTRTDPANAVAAYRRLYPQLQKAYEDLGYPGHYLNDRVVEVIDHLLETPEPTGPILLEQPKVLYRFADADLEARSAGQKLLLRMGVDHARVVKEKLKGIRTLIAGKE
jgi:hypothetical protein